jgi:hypothetical protein
MSETTTCRVVIGMTNDGYTWRCGNPMPCVDHPAPPDAGRATETGHQAQWEAYERIARANGFWHHIEPWAAELTALRARLDASERVREAGVRVEKAITNEGRVPGYHRGVMHRHRVEWPTLWAELDALRTSLARVS